MGITQRKGGPSPQRSRRIENNSTNSCSLPNSAPPPGKTRVEEEPMKSIGNTTKFLSRAHMNKLSKAVVIIPIIMLMFKVATTGFYDEFSPPSWHIRGDGYKIHIDGKRNARSTDLSLGPHQITVLTDDECESTPIFMRIVGDALVDVPLTQDTDQFKVWIGSFEFPIDGSYQLQIDWVGCDQQKTDIQYYNFKASEMSMETKAKTAPPQPDSNLNLFVKGAWIKAMKIATKNTQITPAHKFVWANIEKVKNKEEMSPLKGPEKSMVYEESIVTKEYGYSSFPELTNYEVVCWIGNGSAERSWDAFLALRPQLFARQRPFKFHLYPATNFATPDTTWEASNLRQQNPHGAFRKCKHIFISFEDLGTITQREYRHQVEHFIAHLLNAFNEEHTFPALIWMMTINESAIGTKSCNSQFLQKTSNHPCNDALKDLFAHSGFPDRVRLLDNTDISGPMWGHGSGDVWTAIGLRIFVLVGKQVEIWRNAGISGGVDGLTRNGVVEPNFELVRYDWSQNLDVSSTASQKLKSSITSSADVMQV